MTVLGRQTVLDLYGCDPARLDDPALVEAAMTAAAEAAGATIVARTFHRFAPHGVSGVLVLAQSHATIHTWPEHGYAAVDVFSCDASVEAGAVTRLLVEAFEATASTEETLSRGQVGRMRPGGGT